MASLIVYSNGNGKPPNVQQNQWKRKPHPKRERTQSSGCSKLAYYVYSTRQHLRETALADNIITVWCSNQIPHGCYIPGQSGTS